MTRPPTSINESVTQLRQACPELSGVLDGIGATENSEVGPYTIFGDVLFPLIANVDPHSAEAGEALEVERRIVRARRSIEKAVSMLAPAGDSLIDDGP